MQSCTNQNQSTKLWSTREESEMLKINRETLNHMRLTLVALGNIGKCYAINKNNIDVKRLLEDRIEFIRKAFWYLNYVGEN